MGYCDFWSSLNFIFSQIVRIVCQVLYICGTERWTQFIIQLSVFKKKKYSYFYNNFVSVQVPEIMFPNLNQSNSCKIFLGWHKPRLRKFGINHTCSSTPYFARILPNMQKYFPNQWSMLIFFISGIGPDILMNVLEGDIILPIYVVWVWLSFILSKNKVFQFEALLKIPPSCPSVWSRYSEINKFKIRKQLTFQK